MYCTYGKNSRVFLGLAGWVGAGGATCGHGLTTRGRETSREGQARGQPREGISADLFFGENFAAHVHFTCISEFRCVCMMRVEMIDEESLPVE